MRPPRGGYRRAPGAWQLAEGKRLLARARPPPRCLLQRAAPARRL